MKTIKFLTIFRNEDLQFQNKTKNREREMKPNYELGPICTNLQEYDCFTLVLESDRGLLLHRWRTMKCEGKGGGRERGEREKKTEKNFLIPKFVPVSYHTSGLLLTRPKKRNRNVQNNLILLNYINPLSLR